MQNAEFTVCLSLRGPNGAVAIRTLCRQLRFLPNCQTVRRVVAPYRLLLFHSNDRGRTKSAAIHRRIPILHLSFCILHFKTPEVF